MTLNDLRAAFGRALADSLGITDGEASELVDALGVQVVSQGAATTIAWDGGSVTREGTVEQADDMENLIETAVDNVANHVKEVVNRRASRGSSHTRMSELFSGGDGR